MRGDVRFPSISLATESLYFLPDAVLVVSRNSITALDYNDISVSAETVRFIEEGPAPSDAQIVDQTWRYVNKKGGPDRRFNFNKQLPVCLYSEVNLGSAGGLNARLHISDAAAAEPLINVIDIVRQYTSDTSQFRSITSVGPASKWPTILLCSFTIFFGCVVAVQPIISSAQNWVETTRVKGENRSPMLATRNSEQQAVPPLPVADNVARENSAMNFLVPLPKPRPQQRP
jgi:hypothetical protein